MTISDALAVAALLLGVVNLVMARARARQDRQRRVRDDNIRLSRLLDESYDLLYGREGYSRTKNSVKLLEAEKNIEQALLIDPNNPRAVEYQGHLYEVQGDTKLALSRYRRSIALDPRRARPHNCVGLLTEGEEAQKSFERAIALDPDNAALYHRNLGVLLARRQDIAGAENHFSLAIQQRPQYADAHVELGRILEAAGKRDEARRHYEQAIAADPHHINAMVDLGRLLCEKPETEKDGMDWLEHAHRVDPMDSFPLRMMAAIYADGNQEEKALQYAEKAIAADMTERFEGTTTRELLKAMQKALQDKSAQQAKKAAPAKDA
jgi:Tfp pilus assembly protein PilF